MAYIEYRRFTDLKSLAQDSAVEVTDVLYIPLFDDFEDLSVILGDPDKPGALAAYMDDGVCKLAVYNGDGTWSPVGGDSTPTLQEVTDAGNSTNNPINVIGAYVGAPLGTTISQGSIRLNDNSNANIYAILSSRVISSIGFNAAELTNRFGGGNQFARFLMTPNTTGSQFSGVIFDQKNSGSEPNASALLRVSGADGTYPHNFVTKRQLDAVAPTYTSDPSLPDPPTNTYLNTNYPTAKPGDTVYWEGTTQIVTATCYAVGEWKWITENRCQ